MKDRGRASKKEKSKKEKKAELQSGAPGALHAIRVASKLTGISAETLRMWERRYGFPKPQRTTTGLREYSDSDIARLRLVTRAMRAGYRPNEVVALSKKELTQILSAFEGAPRSPENLQGIPSTRASLTVAARGTTDTADGIESVLAALVADDVARVRTGLRVAAITLGAKRFVTDFVAPFVARIGVAWSRGEIDVRHEHLASECTSTQLRLLLSAHEDGERTPVVILATLPGEVHSLGLEMIAVYLAASGAAPRLLGHDTPPKELANAARAFFANAVGVSVSGTADVARASRDLAELALALPRGIEIWVGGAGARKVRLPKRARVMDTFSQIDESLKITAYPLFDPKYATAR